MDSIRLDGNNQQSREKEIETERIKRKSIVNLINKKMIMGIMC